MRVHPVRNQEEFDNEFNLTEEQIEDLYKAREYLVILIAFEKYLAAGDFSEPFKY